MVREFIPFTPCSEDVPSCQTKSIQNNFYTTDPSTSSSSSPFSSSSKGFQKHQLPHFIAEHNYLNDSCVQAIIGFNTRRGISGGTRFIVKCLTGSPIGSTSIFSRDARSFIMENERAPTSRTLPSYSIDSVRPIAPIADEVMRDGFIGSLRDGCFGSDFAAIFSTKPWIPQQQQQTLQDHQNSCMDGNMQEYYSYIVGESGEVEAIPFVSSNSRRQSFFLQSLHVTDDWLATKADPTCMPMAFASTYFSSNTHSPLGPIYCRNKWQALHANCLSKGLDLERAGFTDKTLFYLRKYIFSTENQPSNSLIQALKLVMYVWADRLSYFLDHDFKNKMKQAEIIKKMHFEPDVMICHLKRLRKAAVEKYLENPIGIKYLQVTGFTSDATSTNAVFSHLSLPEVHTTRSKSFHDKITRCVNMDTLDI
ncbi:UNVERIFIED_CONTAM: hypothetical protein HDU68_002049 [Siphonaria sp. JEL0065]|nr:hypothetical protein HDU68_002049 [Siphonaria sp. JEL0065]